MQPSALVRAIAAVCLVGNPAFAQDWLTVGVKGGLPFTDSFKDRTYQEAITVLNPGLPAPVTTLIIPIHTYSDSKNFLIGPTIELRLPLGLAVEADALYRSRSASPFKRAPRLALRVFC